MKEGLKLPLLLDLCVSSRSLIACLRSEGHDVLSAASMEPGSSDASLMARAAAEGRVLVTEDKDFGELVFVRRLSHGAIVRLVDMNVQEQIEAMREILATNVEDLKANAMITVTRKRIRVRR